MSARLPIGVLVMAYGGPASLDDVDSADALGIFSVVPAIAKLSLLTPLAAASEDSETPCDAAIPLSVSPGWTA